LSRNHSRRRTKRLRFPWTGGKGHMWETTTMRGRVF